MSSCFAANPKTVADLCGLHAIHEAGILANLEGRMGWASSTSNGNGAGGGGGGKSKRRGSAVGDMGPPGGVPQPYTYLSTVLVAVNPLKVLPEQPVFADYVGKSFDPERPHPYAISELSYQNLRVPRTSEPPSQVGLWS